MRARFAFLAIAGLAIAGGSVSASPLIINGDFSQFTGTTGQFVTVNAGDSSITGWTVDTGSVDWINTYWTGADGNHSLDLDGLAAGVIHQDVALGAGEYALKFALAGNPDQSYDKVVKATVYAADNTTVLATQDYTFVQNGHTGTSMGWTDQTLAFSSSSDQNVRVQFTSLTDGSLV